MSLVPAQRTPETRSSPLRAVVESQRVRQLFADTAEYGEARRKRGEEASSSICLTGVDLGRRN